MFKENNIIRKSKLDEKLINQTYEEKPFINIILLNSNNFILPILYQMYIYNTKYPFCKEVIIACIQHYVLVFSGYFLKINYDIHYYHLQTYHKEKNN